MKGFGTLTKAIVVAVIVAGLGYVGLDIPTDTVEEAVEELVGELEQTPATETDAIAKPYQVRSVIDGDTVIVDGEVSGQSVRLVGIDTPETKHSPTGEECYAAEATARAHELLGDTSVIITPDPTQAKYDEYDRLLGYITLSDGRDFGKVMIEEGYAREYTYRNRPYQKQSEYQAAELEAYEAGLGVWSCS
jgi:endonuclease YncB( thermonuclease family)